jgi:integrase
MGQHAKNRLTAKQVETAQNGWLNDGGNLHLRISNGGQNKKWVFRYQRDGDVVEIGLGPVKSVSLKLARQERDKHLETLAKGGDPREEKRKQAAARKGRKTFAQAAEAVIAARRDKWRTSVNDGRTSSLDDWTKSLTVDCKPIKDRYVEDINTDDIEAIIKPYWDNGHADSARRLLKRVEMVFHFAKAKRWRKADNPATWAEFQHILQAQGPSGRKRNHPMLDWRETPAFMARLRASEPTMAALALEMMILTACRSGEVRGMLWTEIDFETATWTVPPERMKRARLHEVPLSTDAVALLRRLEAGLINRFVFPGRSSAKPIVQWSCWALVRRLTGRQDGESSMASPHGFRASFRSWCTARHVPSEIAERCLAHERKDATQQAYDREEMLDARRVWMERWSNFLSGETSDNVVPLKRRVRAPLRRA